MSEENQDSIEQIREEFNQLPRGNAVEFPIKRLPEKTAAKLRDMAFEHFAGDYGAAVTYLVRREELRSEFHEYIDKLDDRISRLEHLVANMNDSEDTQELPTING